MRLMSLPVLVLSVVLASFALPLSAHPSAAQPATPARTPAPFVGETSDSNTFVAVVAEADGDHTERQARAYLCNAAEMMCG